MPGKIEKLLELAEKKQILRAHEAVDAGIARTYLKEAVERGLLERLGRGVYVPVTAALHEWASLAEARKKVGKGVICLLSALQHHGLTTQAPSEVWMALERGSWRPRIDYPPVRFVYFSGAAFHEGIEMHAIGGVDVAIYSAAKTVADCFKYRNKIGIDVAVEALRDYIRNRLGTIDDLWRMAKVCRVANVIRPYLEATV